MKLTKSQLKQLIKEELVLLKEEKNCGCYENLPSELIRCIKGKIDPCPDEPSAMAVKPYHGKHASSSARKKDLLNDPSARVAAQMFLKNVAANSVNVAIDLIMAVANEPPRRKGR